MINIFLLGYYFYFLSLKITVKNVHCVFNILLRDIKYINRNRCIFMIYFKYIIHLLCRLLTIKAKLSKRDFLKTFSIKFYENFLIFPDTINP